MITTKSIDETRTNMKKKRRRCNEHDDDYEDEDDGLKNKRKK